MNFSFQPPQQTFQPMIIPQDKPVYRLKGQFYADDTLYEAGEVLFWEATPNLEMEPLNAMANEALTEYVKTLDQKGQAAAEKAGKSYRSLADAFTVANELAKKEGRRVEGSAPSNTPIMGAKLQKRGGRIKAEKSSIIDLGNKLSLNTHGAVNGAFMEKANGKEEV